MTTARKLDTHQATVQTAGRKAILCRRQDAYGRLYGQLRELPQLFIAT